MSAFGAAPVTHLDCIAMNTADLDGAIRFYTSFLDFSLNGALTSDPLLADLLGVRAVRSSRLQRGAQFIELSACAPSGSAYPADSHSNDLWFQHCALVTDDIVADAARLAASAFRPISRAGPVTLPGGIVAYKFRDPEGHPLELIQFPHTPPATAGGIDHSAISVADAERSIAFYTALGLALQARQVNQGPAQDALDGLAGVRADVISLIPVSPAPHIELLGYRTPRGRISPVHASDIAATRLVFRSSETPRLLRDPDGHLLLLK